MNKAISVIKELAVTFLIALILYLVISLFIKVGIVDGVSMEPTYQDGNYVLIYRRTEEFKQDDIIAFNYGDREDDYFQSVYNSNSEYNYSLHIKRIIGVPGDEIKIFNNSVYVNGEKTSTSQLNLVDQEYKLKDEEYFVQGDNLNDSYDSRMHGPITTKEIYGKIIQFNF